MRRQVERRGGGGGGKSTRTSQITIGLGLRAKGLRFRVNMALDPKMMCI